MHDLCSILLTFAISTIKMARRWTESQTIRLAWVTEPKTSSTQKRKALCTHSFIHLFKSSQVSACKVCVYLKENRQKKHDLSEPIKNLYTARYIAQLEISDVEAGRDDQTGYSQKVLG